MLNIRPVTDLRNNFAENSKAVHDNQEPVFLTKNGYGDMVVMSIEQYSKIVRDNYIAERLKKTTAESESTTERFDFLEASEEMRSLL